jgi:hypothetical protein
MLTLLGVLISGLGGAKAYLDPGSGSFLLQILIAAVLGLGVVLRASWGSIKKWFGKKSAPEDEDVEDDSATE